ncbi:TetR/AcrR family transcriptional regulator C-terminal domain-containing protein [Aquipuribacter nitratireducens]|uniref:TetR/AcrR family transcriptional regulator C-terminal domain-containing protein n=1 Tax=Aquipuribacter nitratireducens TaxID=650104 RepID=A0ABW0GHT9_9MICO
MAVKPRPALDRARVLAVALDVADAEGLPALSMRRLGAELGVEAMSLYHHLPNKAALLAGIADLVAEEVAEPDAALGWRDSLRSRATDTHAALLRHPWCASLWAGQAVEAGPARLRHLDAVLRTLREAGFPPSLLELAFHSVQNHVVGHAFQAVAFARGAAAAEGLDVAARRFLERPGLDRLPDLAAHVRWHAEHPHEESAFGFALELLLDGFEQALAEARPRS